MVYCGRPSKGCQTCRNRRIKCDEGRPFCGQCIKSSRDCLGYRNQNDLLFRNETEVTERRARRNSRRPEALPPPSISSSPLSGGSRTPTSADSDSSGSFGQFLPVAYDTGPESSLAFSIPGSLQVSPEQAALCYFFSNFILVPRHSETSRGYLEYLLPLYTNTSLDSALSSATSAISLATFGNDPERKHLLDSAYQKYSEALGKVNQALRDPVKAKQDDTLMTILLFSLFEESIMPLRLLNLTLDQSITASPETLPQWGLHTDGAIALVKMRGKEQLNNPQSLKLFCAVRTQMIISHILRSKPLDDFYEEWVDLPNGQKENAANRLTGLQLALPDLRARANEILFKPRNDETTLEVIELMQRCKSADERLSQWPSTTPSSWKYQTVATMEGDPGRIDDADIYPGNIDVYYDIWVASIWNSYRATRIFAQAIIVRCIQWLNRSTNYKDLPEFKASKRTLQQMVNEISATVPYNMGYGVRDKDLVESTYPAPQDLPYVRPSHGQSVIALGGYFLLWPLFTAASVVVVPLEQRQWLKGRLVHIAKKLGFNQAYILANKTGPLMNKWGSIGRPAFT